MPHPSSAIRTGQDARRRFAWALSPAVAILMLVGLAAPAAAQFSDRYEFLKALKEQDALKVRQKLNDGQYPNIYDGDGNTALMIAAQNGGLPWVALLVKHEANVDLANKSDSKTVLMYYAERGDGDGVNFLLDRKANPNLTDSFGETALMKAVRARQFRVVKALIDAGANLDLADNSGRTALDHARNARDRRLEKLLLDAGASD
ncbi:MAG: ankyrin repeat domain-containing protein [Pseudomonadota bacterium]